MSSVNNISQGDLVESQIKVEGETLAATFQVHEVWIEQGVNRIGRAAITLLDGDPSTETFPASSSDKLSPGKEVEILAGYDEEFESLFKGIIVNQSLSVDPLMGGRLVLECKDKAAKLTVGRNSCGFEKQKDSDIISSLASQAGLQVNAAATQVTHEQMVQYQCSDWDFIVSRAEANAQVVTTLNGTLATLAPDLSKTPDIEVAYGDNIIRFSGDLNSLNQYKQVKAQAWSPSQQKMLDATASNNVAGAGNISSQTLADVADLEALLVGSFAQLSSDDLTAWSKGQMLKSELAKFQGEVRFQGSHLPKPGGVIKLDGLGDRFNGNHFVSTVVHDISNGNWATECSLGLSSVWFTEQSDVMVPAAEGLLPGIEGLALATVVKITDDPETELRVQINLPILSSQGQTLWARLAQFYATDGAGSFFYPEIGDEVVVGFVNNDPRTPIILGSLYSSKYKPGNDYEPAQDNPKKAIVSKKGYYLEFNDGDEALNIVAGDNKVAIDVKNKSITIEDANSNKVTLTDSGIQMQSPKDISISAEQNLTLKGQAGVTLEASAGDVSLKGINLTEEAQAQWSAKGNATASLQGGAELTLKAAMVMIN